MMAAAEARAAWQRTANRCFVQEDAKRAPKLACCPSPSSKLQPDEAHADVENGVDQSSAHLLPLNWNLSNYNLSPDTKWWLQLQPNYGNQRELLFEQLKAMESEFDGKPPANLSPRSAFSEEATQLREDDFASPGNMSNPASESPFRVSMTNLKHEIERRAQELKTANACQPLNGEVVFSDNLKSEINSKVSTESKQFDDFDHLKLGQAENGSFDISMPWVTDKAGPWWRVTDKDELASLVAHSAIQHIENCDLPQPCCANSRTSSIGIYEGFDRKILSPPFDHKPCTTCFCSHIEGPQQNLSGETNRVQYQSALLSPPVHVVDKNSSNSCEGTKESSGTFYSLDVHASKVQLLEALCHSQTRAREAETAAQRAHSEKEHIIKLFLKQATHLFAYKQWFRLLQLETIYLQLKCKDSAMVPWDQLSALFPWLSARGEQHGDARNKKRKRDDEHKYDVGKFALAVAVGVSLAGAGLFLGWSLGWLLRTF